MTTKKKGGAPASNKAVDALYAIAEEIYEELDGGQIPKMKIPLRTKANIRFDSKHAVWKYGNLMGVRSAKKLKGALMLLRTMYVLEFIRDMIRDSKSSTLREMYYISEGWDIAKFHAQEESNLLAEDLEVITQLLREDFKLRPEESGASVIGNLTLEEITRNGDRKRINCRDDVGDAGYTIPYNVEKEKVKLVESDAKFILAIETGGMFDRLVENALVSSVIRHEAPVEMFEIQAAYGFAARVTGAHSVMVLGDFRFVPRSVLDLRPGDLIVAAMGLPRGERLHEIDVLSLLRETPIWTELRTDIRIGSRRLPLPEGLAHGHTDFRIYGNHSDVPLSRRLPSSRPRAN